VLPLLLRDKLGLSKGSLILFKVLRLSRKRAIIVLEGQSEAYKGASGSAGEEGSGGSNDGKEMRGRPFSKNGMEL
jgi:hypothetical protein